MAALVLGHLNPSQVGTSLASSAGFKRNYGKGNTINIVMDWMYRQSGRCVDCGSRLELQADHVLPKEKFPNPLDADYIENITLRCRRCNVAKRPSHQLAKLTFLTAESALMWILLVIRPRTRDDFVRMCRIYGMTMSDIRMDEAWAMAHWLASAEPPAYGIEDDVHTAYDLLLWPDSAITRVDVGAKVSKQAKRIYSRVPGSSVLGFLTRTAKGRMKFHEQPIAFVPFSTYDLDDRPPQALCVRYAPPNRKKRLPQRVTSLPPRDADLVCHGIRSENQFFRLEPTGAAEFSPEQLSPAPWYGRFIRAKVTHSNCRLVAISRQ